MSGQSPGSLTDQLDPQIEAENVRGPGERVEVRSIDDSTWNTIERTGFG